MSIDSAKIKKKNNDSLLTLHLKSPGKLTGQFNKDEESKR